MCVPKKTMLSNTPVYRLRLRLNAQVVRETDGWMARLSDVPETLSVVTATITGCRRCSCAVPTACSSTRVMA